MQATRLFRSTVIAFPALLFLPVGGRLRWRRRGRGGEERRQGRRHDPARRPVRPGAVDHRRRLSRASARRPRSRELQDRPFTISWPTFPPTLRTEGPNANLAHDHHGASAPLRVADPDPSRDRGVHSLPGVALAHRERRRHRHPGVLVPHRREGALGRTASRSPPPTSTTRGGTACRRIATIPRPTSRSTRDSRSRRSSIGTPSRCAPRR